MPARRPSILKGIAHTRSLRHLHGLEARIRDQDIASVRALRTQARELLRTADRAVTEADARLAAPLSRGAHIDAPVQSDWRWRPELWSRPVHPSGVAAPATRTGLGAEITLHHDCPAPEMVLRQIRNTHEEDVAPFGAALDVMGFAGSFLSLTLDLPADAMEGLSRRHILRLMADLDAERGLPVYARLNIRHGPNTEQVARELPSEGRESIAEWDLAYVEMNEKRLDAAWIDLIFEAPAYNRIVLRDLTLSRRPRADF